MRPRSAMAGATIMKGHGEPSHRRISGAWKYPREFQAPRNRACEKERAGKPPKRRRRTDRARLPHPVGSLAPPGVEAWVTRYDRANQWTIDIEYRPSGHYYVVHGAEIVGYEPTREGLARITGSPSDNPHPTVRRNNTR